MNSLTYAATTLTLPVDLVWGDEFAWRAVEQRTQYTLTGALLVDAYVKQAGRPITLRGDSTAGWVTRADLNTLRAWAALPAQAFSLVLRGEAARDVIFDHAGGAIDAAPVAEFSDPEDDDYYVVTLRFIEI
jgi:hypothetical protein